MKLLQFLSPALILIQVETFAQSSSGDSGTQTNAGVVAFDKIAVTVGSSNKAHSFLDLHHTAVRELRRKYKNFSDNGSLPAVVIYPTSQDRFLALNYGPMIGRTWFVYFDKNCKLSATLEGMATARK